MTSRPRQFLDETPVLSLSYPDTLGEAEWIESNTFIDQWRYNILLEGEQLDNDVYKNQAQEIAGLLVSIAKNDFVKIQKFCLNLYTRETFLFKLLNEVLGNRDTNKNPDLAMIYRNTLFIITIDGSYISGLDISSLSNFPEEEEILNCLGRTFSTAKVEFNTTDNKYRIRLSMFY
ncbi:hypothetical protein I4U23_011046 [Adineta vaga]|nr:hypothetical protein I4U23_011046 [Adineta vaga]